LDLFGLGSWIIRSKF